MGVPMCTVTLEVYSPRQGAAQLSEGGVVAPHQERRVAKAQREDVLHEAPSGIRSINQAMAACKEYQQQLPVLLKEGVQ